MSLEASISALTPPSGVAWHANPAEHLQWLVQYLRVIGLGDFNGVNFGVQTPSAENRDKPWYRINSDGGLMGWYGWNGSEWTQASEVKKSGTTAQRPANPAEGQEYFDTDVKASLIFERNRWRLDDGAPPGTLKFWDGNTLAEALAANPGYSFSSKIAGRSPMAAGIGDGLTERTAGQTIGTETHALTADENGPHTHTFGVSYSFNNNGGDCVGDGGAAPNRTWSNTTASSGTGKPHNNIHPVYVCWVLRKD